MPPTDGKLVRLVGNSVFVDSETGREYQNSWLIEDKNGEASVQVGPKGEAREAPRLRTSHRHTRWFMGKIRREMMSARRRFEPVFRDPKPVTRRKYGRCTECNGTHETYIDDVLVPCPVCRSKSARS